MKRAAILLLRFYPKAWRARYGDEIGALLEDGPVRWRALPDLLRGAMKEQFNMQSFTRLVGWFSAAGLVAGFLGSFAVTPRYTSHALISLNTPRGAGILQAGRAELLSRASLAEIINNPRLDLYRQERMRTPMEWVEDEMRQDLILTAPDPNKAVVAIAFTYSDPAKAQAATQDAIDTLIYRIQTDFNQQHSRQIDSVDHDQKYLAEINRLEAAIAVLETRLGMPPQTNPVSSAVAPPLQARDLLTVLDPPSFPAHPVSPTRAVFAAWGFGGGIGAALLTALLRRRPPSAPDPIALS